MLQRICPKCWKMFPLSIERCPTDGSDLALPEDRDLTGTRLHDKYDVISIIGQGGMGYVYKAHQIRLNRPVAIKVLRSSLIQNETVVKRFINEAKASAMLRSPNTIILHDFDISPEGNIYYEMELLEGCSLSSVIRHHAPVPLSVAAGYILQACDSLEEAHAKGILHRDIKPDNLFLARMGDKEILKVLDFGIARMLEGQGAEARLTSSGMVIGTPEYISPEQATGVDALPCSDLYSLSLVLYELLTGHRPFQEPTAIMTMAAHVKTPLPSLSTWQVDIQRQAQMEAFLQKALAKTPKSRYQSVAEYREALRIAVAGSPSLTVGAVEGTPDTPAPDATDTKAKPQTRLTIHPPPMTPVAQTPPPQAPSLPTGTSREIPRPRVDIHPPTVAGTPRAEWTGNIPEEPATRPAVPHLAPGPWTPPPSARDSRSGFLGSAITLGVAVLLAGSVVLWLSRPASDSSLPDYGQEQQLAEPDVSEPPEGKKEARSTHRRGERPENKRPAKGDRKAAEDATAVSPGSGGEPLPSGTAAEGDEVPASPAPSKATSPRKGKVGVKDIMAAAAKTTEGDEKSAAEPALQPSSDEVPADYSRRIEAARAARKSLNYGRCIRQANLALSLVPDSREAADLALECTEKKALLSTPEGTKDESGTKP